MKKNVIALGIAGALSIPGAASAIQIAGEELEAYFKIHMSVYQADPDVSTQDSQIGVSSNSSRIGFKGKHVMENGMTALFQLEQEVSFDESGGNFASRNSFVGLSNGFGTVLAGYHDTPFKEVGADFTLFGDTIADRRAILGSGVGANNVINDRGANMIMYKNMIGPTEVKIMYSPSSPSRDVSGTIDDNDNALFSGSVVYKDGPLAVGLAIETQDNASNAAAPTTQKVDGSRLGVMYDFGMFGLGAIFETLSSDDIAGLDRDAFGVNGTLKLSNDVKLQAQVLVADENATVETGATMTSLGVTKKLDKKTDVYFIYTSTSNDDAANYRGIEGGHGDELGASTGSSPSAFALGFVHAI